MIARKRVAVVAVPSVLRGGEARGAWFKEERDLSGPFLHPDKDGEQERHEFRRDAYDNRQSNWSGVSISWIYLSLDHWLISTGRNNNPVHCFQCPFASECRLG